MKLFNISMCVHIPFVSKCIQQILFQAIFEKFNVNKCILLNAIKTIPMSEPSCTQMECEILNCFKFFLNLLQGKFVFHLEHHNPVVYSMILVLVMAVVIDSNHHIHDYRSIVTKKKRKIEQNNIKR